MRQRLGSILWGIFLVAIGVGIAGGLLKLWTFELFFNGWWTLLILIPSFISLLQNGPRISNAIWMTIGLLMLACCRGYLEWTTMWKLFIPLIFIIIGLGMVLRSMFHFGGGKVSIPSEMKTQDTLVFSGKRYTVENRFYGMNLDSVFAGATLDLRNAVIEENISLELLAVFGGIEVLAPNGVSVELHSNSLFGGCSNHHVAAGPEAPTIYVNATALFGGVEVK